MKCKEITIVTARINGLNEQPYYLQERCIYTWNITFTDASAPVGNLANIKLGENLIEAEELCNQFKKNFSEAGIKEGDKVALILGKDCWAKAIGCIGEDSWIDVDNMYIRKEFKELNIHITSLKVY